MAYFASIDNTSTVVEVLSVPEDQEHRGAEYLSIDLGLGGVWLRTSYNTRGGVHYDPATGEPSADQWKAFRKNYAGIGYTYDEQRDAFIPAKPDKGDWVLDDATCLWVEVTPPSPDPDI